MWLNTLKKQGPQRWLMLKLQRCTVTMLPQDRATYAAAATSTWAASPARLFTYSRHNDRALRQGTWIAMDEEDASDCQREVSFYETVWFKKLSRRNGGREVPAPTFYS
jgi:hypothetical protein